MAFLYKIISGGQTGIDQIGLRVGRLYNLQTGGTAPKGWKTETGPNPKLAEYGLIESPFEEYPIRTEDNVRDSDVTVIFGDLTSPGSVCTLKAIRKHKKKHIANPSADQLIAFLNRNHVRVLNVAGNRGSHLTKADREKYGGILSNAIANVILDELPF